MVFFVAFDVCSVLPESPHGKSWGRIRWRRLNCAQFLFARNVRKGVFSGRATRQRAQGRVFSAGALCAQGRFRYAAGGVT